MSNHQNHLSFVSKDLLPFLETIEKEKMLFGVWPVSKIIIAALILIGPICITVSVIAATLFLDVSGSSGHAVLLIWVAIVSWVVGPTFGIYYMFRSLKPFNRRAIKRLKIRTDIMDKVAARMGLDYATVAETYLEDTRSLLKQGFSSEYAINHHAENGWPNDWVTVARSALSVGLLPHQGVTFDDGFRSRTGPEYIALEFECPVPLKKRKKIRHEHRVLIAIRTKHKILGSVRYQTKHIDRRTFPDDVNFKSVKLGSDAISRRFIIEATDQVQARYLLDPTMMERLLGFASQRPIAGAYTDNLFIFSIAGEDRFSLMDWKTGKWSRQTSALALGHFDELTNFVTRIVDLLGRQISRESGR